MLMVNYYNLKMIVECGEFLDDESGDIDVVK